MWKHSIIASFALLTATVLGGCPGGGGSCCTSGSRVYCVQDPEDSTDCVEQEFCDTAGVCGAGCIEGANDCGYETAYDCSDWTPRAQVEYASGVYSLSAAFVYNLVEVERWQALWACDTARVVPSVGSTGFEVDNISSGDLLYMLGLREGDKFVEINGWPLLTPYDSALAYVVLWLLEGEQSYQLKVLRGGAQITLQYALIAV